MSRVPGSSGTPLIKNMWRVNLIKGAPFIIYEYGNDEISLCIATFENQYHEIFDLGLPRYKLNFLKKLTGESVI